MAYDIGDEMNKTLATIYNPMTGKQVNLQATKSGSLLWDESTDAWTYLTGAPKTKTEYVYQAVPAIFRGVSKIAQAVADMPFYILNGAGDIVDSSDDYQNVMEWWTNPGAMLGITSQALDLTGTAYHRILANRGGYIKELRYQAPSTIEPIYDKRTGDLLNFKRSVGATPETIPVEEMMYFWLPDPNKENEPPGAYPVQAAMNAAGILKNLASYVIVYFERGAIRPLIASVPSNTSEAERNRLKEWIQKTLTGMRNARETNVFNADSVKFDTFGDGLDSLQKTELTKEQREEVCAALGVPYSMLFQLSGGGLSGGSILSEDEANFYKGTVIPRCEFIAAVMNSTIFSPRGYKLSFRPETLDIFQVDENERSESAARITQAVVANPKAFKMSAMILGMEIPPEAKELLDELIEEKETAREVFAERLDQPAQDSGEDDDQDDDEESLENQTSTMPQNNQQTRAALVQWHRRTLKCVKQDKPIDDEFVSDDIPRTLYNSIMAQLKAASSAEDVNHIFDSVFAEMRADTAPLLGALSEAIGFLRSASVG